MVLPEPDMHEGWLWKEGHVAKTWKRRFFVLEHGVLEYFEDPEAAKSALGRIALSGASQVTGSLLLRMCNADSERRALRRRWRPRLLETWAQAGVA